jgi:hypothetical protein
MDPVDRLSTTLTRSTPSVASNFSQILEPINPAPPVTKTFNLDYFLIIELADKGKQIHFTNAAATENSVSSFLNELSSLNIKYCN